MCLHPHPHAQAQRPPASRYHCSQRLVLCTHSPSPRLWAPAPFSKATEVHVPSALARCIFISRPPLSWQTYSHAHPVPTPFLAWFPGQSSAGGEARQRSSLPFHTGQDTPAEDGAGSPRQPVCPQAALCRGTLSGPQPHALSSRGTRVEPLKQRGGEHPEPHPQSTGACGLKEQPHPGG